MFRVVRFVPDDALMAEAERIREQVFWHEQRVPPELERDGLDPACEHFLLFDRAAAIGAARLRAYEGAAKVERVAVLAAHRGRGAGQALMAAVIARAGERGFPRIVLNAQTAVEGFYAALGFSPEGERFVEAGIAHVRMTRRL